MKIRSSGITSRRISRCSTVLGRLQQACLLQSHVNLFNTHWYAFQVFVGIPTRGIYDNMKATPALPVLEALNGWLGDHRTLL